MPYRVNQLPMKRWGATRWAKWYVRLFCRRVRCQCHKKMIRRDRVWFGGWSESWWCGRRPS